MAAYMAAWWYKSNTLMSLLATSEFSIHHLMTKIFLTQYKMVGN